MASPDLSALKIQHDDEPRRVNSHRRWIVAGAIVAIITALGWLAWHQAWLPHRASTVRVTRPQLLQPTESRQVLTATGYIVPQLRADVSARTFGRLAWLGVREGSQVHAGDVIARLEQDDRLAQVAEARATLAQTRAALEQARSSEWEARREKERQENLLREGITTQSDFDAARRALEVAIAGTAASEEAINAARARLELSRANLEKTVIRAPFDGTVIAKNAEIGEMVAASAASGQVTGGTIATIADFSTLEIEVDINESNLSRVAPGQPVVISVDALPDRKYRGVLRQIMPTADRQRAVVIAKVKILDLDDRLVPDMSARIVFLDREISREEAMASPRVFVPSAAITVGDGSPFVLTVREDRLARIDVSLGEARGDLREVTSGLSGREMIIVAGAKGLREGDPLRIEP